jgi:hypothetical protein
VSCMLLSPALFAQVLITLTGMRSTQLGGEWLIDDLLRWYTDHSVYPRTTMTDGTRPEYPWDTAACLVRDWQHANVLAYRSRYAHIPECSQEGTHQTTSELQETARTLPKMPLACLAKALSCIHYQCSETVPLRHRDQHEAVLDQLKHACHLIHYLIVRNSPEFKEYPWGSIYTPKPSKEVAA